MQVWRAHGSKRLEGSLLTNQDSMESKAVFFFWLVLNPYLVAHLLVI